MSIRKRKGSDVWHIDFRTPGGGRIRQTTGTTDKKEAQELHDKLKHETWRIAKMGERPRYVFEQAATRYLTEQISRADYDDRVAHIRHFLTHFAGRDLGSITRPEIMAAIPTQSVKRFRKTPLKAATRNRYLATIRALMLDAAKDWEWIDKAPSLPEFPEPSVRIRWITRDEARRLLWALDEACMRAVTAFCFATGLRQRNILEMEWTQVDLVSRRAWIHPDQAKARKPIGVPLNDDAVALLRGQIGQHETFVFVREGKPLKKWDDWKWRAACRRANISNFRFHDVRHTWASWHVQNGTPLQVLKELGGWATFEMVLRYAHLAPDHLAHHASAVLLQEPARLVAVK